MLNKILNKIKDKIRPFIPLDKVTFRKIHAEENLQKNEFETEKAELVKAQIKLSEQLLLTSYFTQSGAKPRVIFLGAPSHDNIGDHALTVATRNFVLKNLSEYQFIRIDDQKYFEFLPSLLNLVRSNDLLLLSAGGNLGNEYMLEERIRRSVLLNFPANKVVILPQTCYFTPDETGKKELQKSCAIYNSHANLYIFAREKRSLELIRQYFPKSHPTLAPDMVLYENKAFDSVRMNALCCLRSDLEKVISPEEYSEIKGALLKRYQVIETDNNIMHNAISMEGEVETVEDKLQEFRSAKIIFTDRLHGMIFSAITGTPCIAFGNYNHKIRSFYETWFAEKCPYIRFATNAKEAIAEISNLLDHPVSTEQPDYSAAFSELIQTIK